MIDLEGQTPSAHLRARLVPVINRAIHISSRRTATQKLCFKEVNCWKGSGKFVSQ